MEKKSYTLTEGEQRTMSALAQRVLLEKIRVYSLNQQLEAALQAVSTAENQFQGAMSLLANSRGMRNAQLSPDCSVIQEN